MQTMLIETFCKPWRSFTGIASVINHRVLAYSYSDSSPLLVNHLNGLLEARTTPSQRRQMHRDFEAAVINYQLPFRDPGSGFVCAHRV